MIEATDGRRALELLGELQEQGHAPCLIVLDINMPRMDGRQTLLALQADTVPVVAFSTSFSDFDRLWFAKRNFHCCTILGEMKLSA
ncbi:response regulator [Paraflavisolibacter sp. H34]|uniref:response regulator n=1 Tax=Huijunlia imazamoxiresistens TaxID=3127457 RepID=UPI0039C96876